MEKEMATHSSILAQRILWTEEPGGLLSIELHRVRYNWSDLARMHACIGEGNGNPLQYSCLENPRDRGAWQAAIYGVAQSRTRLKRLSGSSSNRQIWPWNTEWSRAKTNKVLPRERTGHSKHPLPTTQEKSLHMDITRWSTPKSDWLYWLYSLQPKMEKLYTVNKNKTRSWLWLRSWAPYYQIQTQIEESRENR